MCQHMQIIDRLDATDLLCVVQYLPVSHSGTRFSVPTHIVALGYPRVPVRGRSARFPATPDRSRTLVKINQYHFYLTAMNI